MCLLVNMPRQGFDIVQSPKAIKPNEGEEGEEGKEGEEGRPRLKAQSH